MNLGRFILQKGVYRLFIHLLMIFQANEWAEDLDTDELRVFHVAKRHHPYHHWEPIHITTHREPLFDERLVYEGKHDKHTQVSMKFTGLHC